MEIRPVIDWIINTYLDNHREKTLKHVKAVAGTAVWLAGLHRLDPEKAETAAMLHDISVIMTPQQMYEEAQKRKMKIDPADEKYHFYKLGKVIRRKDTKQSLWGHRTWRLDLNRLFNALPPGEYELYVSFKLTGPAYVKGSKKENAVYTDRIIAVCLSSPKAKKSE